MKGDGYRRNYWDWHHTIWHLWERYSNCE